MPEARQRTNQSMEIRRVGGGGSWIRRDVYPASRLRSRQRQIAVPSTDDKENIPPPGTRVRSRRSPLPHWYPRTPLRDITVVVRALERRKRLRASAAARRRNPTNAEEPSISGSSPVVAETNASVANTPGSQEVDLSSSHAASPPIAASPSSSISAASTPQQNLCLLAHSSKGGDPKTAEFERKLENTILELEKLHDVHNLSKTLSFSRGGTRVLMSMR